MINRRSGVVTIRYANSRDFHPDVASTLIISVFRGTYLLDEDISSRGDIDSSDRDSLLNLI